MSDSKNFTAKDADEMTHRTVTRDIYAQITRPNESDHHT